VLLPGIHLDGDPRGHPAWRSAVSKLSASRCWIERSGDLEAVDHDLDRVLAVSVELRQLVDLVHLAVDAHAHESLGAQLVEELGLLALAAPPRAARGSSRACPPGGPSTWSTICETLCAESAISWSGQYGSPTRAKSSRR
jgi:hypothetical protein